MKKLIKHTFVPHKGNNYHPHLFRKGVLVAVTSFALVILMGGALHRIVLRTTDSLAAVYSKALISLTNNDRAGASLAELQPNLLLQEAARLKAEDMASKGYFAHYGPDGSAPWYWIEKAGYRYESAGENLAIDFTDSDDVERAWMNSPTHKANILNSKFTEIGIATAEGKYNGHHTVFVVQMFGYPKPAEKPSSSPLGKSAEAATVVTTSSSTESTSTIVFARVPTSSHATTSSAVLGVEYVATHPSNVVRIIYGILLGVFFVGLLCLIVFEYRKQDKKHRLYAILMICMLGVCLYVYNHYVATQVRISPSGVFDK